MKLDDPRLWTPQHPFLYKMEVGTLDIQQCKLFFRSGLALETKSTLMLVSEPFNLPRKEKRKSFFSMENHWIFRLLLSLNSVYILFNVLKIFGCIDIVSRLVPWTKATGLTDSLLLLVKKPSGKDFFLSFVGYSFVFFSSIKQNRRKDIFQSQIFTALRWDLERMKEMGFNMVRKHIKIEVSGRRKAFELLPFSLNRWTGGTSGQIDWGCWSGRWWKIFFGSKVQI